MALAESEKVPRPLVVQRVSQSKKYTNGEIFMLEYFSISTGTVS